MFLSVLQSCNTSTQGRSQIFSFGGATGGASFATRWAVNGLCRTFRKRPTPVAWCHAKNFGGPGKIFGGQWLPWLRPYFYLKKWVWRPYIDKNSLVTVCGHFASETSLGLNTEFLHCRSQGSETIGPRPGPGGTCYRPVTGTGRIFLGPIVNCSWVGSSIGEISF